MPGLSKNDDIDGVAGNFVASYGEDQRVGVAFARHGDFYDGALGALEQVGDFGGGEAVGRLFRRLF